MTYRQITETDLWLPGDVLGGAIFAPSLPAVVYQQHAVILGPDDAPESKRMGPWLAMPCSGEWAEDVAPADCWHYAMSVREDEVQWDCRDEAMRDRLRRVLAVGERCARCEGDGGWRTHASGGPIAFPGECTCCHGTGYTRPPHDLAWLTDAELSGRITPLEAAALWWCSALRVEAGLGAVRGVLDRWGAVDSDSRDMFLPVLDDPGTWCHVENGAGWEFCIDWHRLAPRQHGPEAGDAGKAAADAAALSAGYALHNGDHILLPHPDGPVRLDLPNTETP